MPIVIDADAVTKSFAKGGGSVPVLDRISLTVEDGEFVVLLGPSGCGKSTFLRILAGLTQATSGRIAILGREMVRPHPAVGMVFQAYTSFPWLTVEGNVAFGLELTGMTKAARTERVASILRIVGLSDFGSHYPAQLSGGMQQRLAIARTLAVDPQVLLMDEPFGALDSLTRMKMQAFLLELWHHNAKTVVFVTHDIDEAILLADRIVVLSPHPGRILRVLPVSISRPRRLDMTEDAPFIALRHELRQLVLSMEVTPAPRTT